CWQEARVVPLGQRREYVTWQIRSIRHNSRGHGFRHSDRITYSNLTPTATVSSKLGKKPSAWIYLFG
ncbi:hypothetical protein, partial [Moorena bouillonii]|uniref:hypothetical protein n=1 Tax=Moorena bouillonii TaxID=207920 RepID=UPI001BE062A8